MKTVIFAKDVNLSKLVEMLKICPCCKYVSNLYQTITFTSLLRINTYLANICICPHFSRQRKCNANLELQIYHIFAPFANISKSVFSSSVVRIKMQKKLISYFMVVIVPKQSLYQPLFMYSRKCILCTCSSILLV